MRDDDLTQGICHDPSMLPPHMKRLHRQVVRAARADREQQRLPADTTDEQRRWPGLVNDQTKEPHA